MTTRILIVEDDTSLQILLRYNLEVENFIVDIVDSSDKMEELFIAGLTPDLIILDWMLPGVSGIELCRRLRVNRDTCNIPIIMLTARTQEGDRIRGLSTGADDYLTKPFSIAELIARIKAVLRRVNRHLLSDLIAIGDIKLHRKTYQAHRATRRLKLSPIEFRLLELLMTNPGRVYSRNQLLNKIWGHESYIGERTVDVYIKRLRATLNRRKDQDPIETIHGIGYAFSGLYGIV